MGVLYPPFEGSPTCINLCVLASRDHIARREIIYLPQQIEGVDDLLLAICGRLPGYGKRSTKAGPEVMNWRTNVVPDRRRCRSQPNTANQERLSPFVRDGLCSQNGRRAFERSIRLFHLPRDLAMLSVRRTDCGARHSICQCGLKSVAFRDFEVCAPVSRAGR